MPANSTWLDKVYQLMAQRNCTFGEAARILNAHSQAVRQKNRRRTEAERRARAREERMGLN